MAGTDDGTFYLGLYVAIVSQMQSHPFHRQPPHPPPAVRSHALFGGAITFALPASFASVGYVKLVREPRDLLFALPF